MNLKKISFYIRMLVTLLLLYFVYTFFDIQFDGLMRSFYASNKQYLFSAFALMPLTISIQILKWHLLLGSLDKKMKLQSAAISHLAGMTLGIVTPARIGELSRAWFLRGVPQMEVVGLTILDKFYSILAYFSIGMITSFIFLYDFGDLNISLKILFYVLAAGTYLFISIALLNPLKIGKMIKFTGKLIRKKEYLNIIASSWSMVTRRRIFVVYGLAGAVWSSVITQLYLLIRAFEVVPLYDGLVSASTAHFVKTLLPLTLGELGIREASVSYFFGKLGVDESAAFSAAILMLLINVILPALVGAIFIIRLKIGRGSNGNHESNITGQEKQA